ncbi:hypothetical protein [Nocardiopsis alborubida]|uniref:Uncharacterized protein n=1 Tax=Nocardiopsis alborubida TaxID=146802 RepID=A0A7X6RP84_9ACTN|nr:hypothetical protein [Nocardiopsis alborubida]NKY97328.1 hypothetical protein [Nocardiopsis alborubida]
MTLVRKGTRRITVDGNAYRWRTRKGLTRAQRRQPDGGPMTFVVEGAVAPGNPLVVTLGHPRPQGDNRPLRAPTGPEPEPVTPARVAAAVRGALAGGWRPGESGGPFRLDGSAL